MTETTKYGPKIYNRHSVRLLGYDYASAGYYFVTICTQDRKRLFGRIRDQKMELNGLGRIARDELLKTPLIRPNTDIDAWVVMPDHIHMIMHIQKDANHSEGPYTFTPDMVNGAEMMDKTVMAPVGAHDFDIADKTVMAPVGAHSCAPLQPPMRLFRRPQSVSSCVAQYKATTTRIINRIRDTQGVRIWQRNFNDRIIRDQEELDYYRGYIRDNPKNGKGGKSIL